MTAGAVVALWACNGVIGGSGDESGVSGDVLSPDLAECRERPPDPGESSARRLTHAEYQNTVFDVLGVDVSAEVAQLTPDIRVEGFTNNAATLVVTGELANAYRSLAHSAAEKIENVDDFVSRFARCQDASDDCREEFIRRLGTKLMRTSLEPEQIGNFASLFEVAEAEGDGFTVGAKLVVEAMLQSAQFLYRVENQPPSSDAPNPVSPHELASRLAYLVWGSAPDDALLDAAMRGDLDEPDQRETEVVRMLEHPRARETARRYFADWLGLDVLEALGRDQNRYPNFNRQLARDMKEETLRFFDHLVWEEQGAITDIYTRQYTFATPALAEFYGLPPAGDGFQRYDLIGVPDRIGVLTQGAVLATHAGGDDPSLVRRGLFVLHDLLCDSVPSPPDNVDTTPPDTAKGTSQRNRSEERVKNASCGGCHAQFDPFGYVFERYDSVGAARAEDEHGNMLRSDGLFQTKDGKEIPFSDVQAFVQTLADRPRARTCTVRKQVQFALGRVLGAADGCTLVQIEDAVSQRGGTYQDLLIEIARHPSFRLIRAESERDN